MTLGPETDLWDAHHPRAAQGARPWDRSYPAGIAWDEPVLQEPLALALDRAVAAFGERPCLDFLGRSYSYAQVGDLVARTAKGLQDLGVAKGTRVALFLPNTPYYVVAYFAVMKLGGIVVNVNPLYAEEEVHELLADSGAEFAVTMDLKLLLPKLTSALAPDTRKKCALKKIIVGAMGDILRFPTRQLFAVAKRGELARPPAGDDRYLRFSRLIDNDGDFTPAEVGIGDVAVLQYTGGTTGLPKGAMLTHGSISANVSQLHTWFIGVEPGTQRVLAVLPLFHVFAMTVNMHLGIRLAGEIILMPRFEIKTLLQTIARRRPTFFPGVPTLFNAILHYPKLERYDLSCIEVCISGGAGLPAPVHEGFENLTGGRLFEGYGLSEASPVVTCNPIAGSTKVGSIGLPLPGTEVVIRSLDNRDQEVPLGERGEICLRGPQVMAGYWQRPEASAETLRHGWLHTGDVGYMDEDGYTYLIDRLKEVIVSGGYKVYPRHVEEAIHRHPAVAEVICCAKPDEYRGEVPKAFVRLKEGETLNEEDLRAFLADKLSPMEMPREVEFREELPKTMIGKLSKKELIAHERAKHDEERAKHAGQEQNEQGPAGESPPLEETKGL
ncbi:long-chain-fatty-acid--CoA ligase [Pelagibius marinus]|uniref:long-chain-fatty-acid--CoA ligase n=1 Tax=Pelagibius marinus TaxID=2762760 RepID=UPI0018727895|nr:long-chain fatty acid--CoA ligase [Pelagibius marinus]